MAGRWKSPAEATQTFSFSGMHHGQDLYRSSSPTSLFSSASTAGSIAFNGNSTPSALTGNPVYWPIKAANQDELYSPCINKEPNERKQDTGNNGYRLFGIQLIESSVVEEISPVVAVSACAEDQPAPSQDVDFDRQCNEL